MFLYNKKAASLDAFFREIEDNPKDPESFVVKDSSVTIKKSIVNMVYRRKFITAAMMEAALEEKRVYIELGEVGLTIAGKGGPIQFIDGGSVLFVESFDFMSYELCVMVYPPEKKHRYGPVRLDLDDINHADGKFLKTTNKFHDEYNAQIDDSICRGFAIPKPKWATEVNDGKTV